MAGESKKKFHPTGVWTWAFGLSLCAIGLILALGSYQADDPSFSSFSSAWRAPKNVLGYVGSWTSDALLQIFGVSAWFLPVLLLTALLRWMAHVPRRERVLLGTRWWLGLALVTGASTLLIDLSGWKGPHTTYPSQGLVGIALSSLFIPFFGRVGSYLGVLALAWAFCMTWWEELPAYFVNACTTVARALLPILAKMKVASAAKAASALSGWLAGHGASAEGKETSSRLRNELKAKLAAEKAKEAAARAVAAEAVESEGSEETTDEAEAAFDAEGDDGDLDAGDEDGPNRKPLIRQSSQTPAEKASARERLKKAAAPAKPAHWDLPPLSLLELPKKK